MKVGWRSASMEHGVQYALQHQVIITLTIGKQLMQGLCVVSLDTRNLVNITQYYL